MNVAQDNRCRGTDSPTATCWGGGGDGGPLVRQSRWRAWFAPPGRRGAIFAILLVLTASVTSFYRLGDGTLIGDEAAFALTTDRMRATGDWVVPYIGDEPHFNATPLYNWLTLAIAPWFDQVPLWYRSWSAVFGVGCVLLTFVLGTVLFRAEVGFLASLFLTFNRDFFFCHGVRFGGMDALTTFFLTGAVICYAWQLGRSGRAWPAWAVLGMCIGLAWLSKPPVFGCFFLAAMGLHHGWVERRQPWVARLGGPLLALGLGLGVAAGWYLLLWRRLGDLALYQLFVVNSVGRALNSPGRDFRSCHIAFWHASISFKMMELALVSGIACWLSSGRRSPWGLLLFVAGSFLIGLTAAGRAGNYIFYAFPLLCVLLAGMLLESGPKAAAWYWSSSRAGFRAAVVGACLAGVAVSADAVRVLSILNGPVWTHPPVRVYERFASQPDSLHCRFIMFDFPWPPRTTAAQHCWQNYEDMYYAPRMSQAHWVETIGELKYLLDDPRPAVVVLPPLSSPAPALAPLWQLGAEERVDLGMWKRLTYPVLTFHGAATALNLGDLLDPGRRRPR